ncbi:isoflavone 7-O-methyltransferase [Trifolium repens]|nr:isoflavone 7-O-methyltransferase [Trifolium repens]
MESDSRVVKLALRDCKSVFDGLVSLVDVEGGTGNTSKIICETFPMLKCIVLDLPQVVADLSGNGNLSFMGGNMFHSIPRTDTILLKWILHNWNDEGCVKILKNCKEAVSRNDKGGKIIIIDTVINEKQDEHEMTEVKLFFDIIMMASFNAKERDEENWKKIFNEAGYLASYAEPDTQVKEIKACLDYIRYNSEMRRLKCPSVKGLLFTQFCSLFLKA